MCALDVIRFGVAFCLILIFFFFLFVEGTSMISVDEMMGFG